VKPGRLNGALALASIGALALAGCGAPPDEVTPWVHVGHGQHSVAPLLDGDEVELVFGPQGGWHIDLGARFGGVMPDGQFLTFRVWDPQHSDQIGYPIKTFVVPDVVVPYADEGFDRSGVSVVFAIKSASEVVGRQWLVEAELIHRTQVVRDSRLVRVVDHHP